MIDDARQIDRRVGIAALIVAGGVLLSRVLGQIREIIFAWLLGASSITDQYVAAFRIPDFLNYLLAGGFLSITFIPIFARYLATDDEEGGWRALTAIIRPIALGITVLVGIGWIVTPWVIEALYPGFTPGQIASTIRLTRIVLPAQIFFVVGALFSAVQYTKGRFVVPSLAPIAYNIGIILGGVLDPVLTGEAGPEGFIWGALGGALFGNFLLQWWGARRVGMHLVGGTEWGHPALFEYVRIAFPLMIGQSIVVLDETFMSVFGDRVGDAAQTHLQYARRTMLVPVGGLAQAAGVAAFPFLARLHAEGRETEMADTVDRTLRYVLVLSLAATALVVALTQPAIRTQFQRGQFGPADTVATASALFFYAFAIPIWGALQVLTRAFYARREMWPPVIIGTLASIAAVPVYFGLQERFGLEGVALASTVTLGLYTAALGWRWYRAQDRPGRIRRVVDAPARAVPLAVIAGFAAFATAWIVALVLGDGWWAGLVATIAGTAVFVVAALGLGAAFLAWFGPGRPQPQAVV